MDGDYGGNNSGLPLTKNDKFLYVNSLNTNKYSENTDKNPRIVNTISYSFLFVCEKKNIYQ
jgi:hypothetical protein